MILHAASTIIFEIAQFKSLCVILFFSTFAVPPPLHNLRIPLHDVIKI